MPATSHSGSSISDRLARAGASHPRIARDIVAQPARMRELFDGLHDARARVRFGWSRVLRLLAQSHPQVVYPHWARIQAMLNEQNQIMVWTAILVMGDLARVDSANLLQRIIPRLLRLIDGPVMITAANVLKIAPSLARARPDMVDRIVRGILRVEQARYQTEECRNIAIGHALSALSQFPPSRKAAAFAQRQSGNARPATRRKAQAYLTGSARTRSALAGV